MDRKKLSSRSYYLQLKALSVAEGIKNGTFRSLYRGQGVGLNGVREYFAGDDVRHIDWNTTARMNHPYVKVLEEEKEIDVLLIVDASCSMGTGSGRQSRLETAIDAASLFTFASYHNRSPVGAVFFGDDIKFSCPPRLGWDQVLLLLNKLDDLKVGPGKGSALDNALRGAARLLKKKSMVIVVSDFRSSGWVEPFANLCTKHEVIALRISDMVDAKLSELGSIPFEDPETGVLKVFPTSSPTFSRQWREFNRQNWNVWQKECIRHGGYPLTIDTDEDPIAKLIKFFSTREMR